jgi:transposase-like protein
MSINEKSKTARRFTAEVKWQSALEVIQGKQPGQVSKAYGVHPTSVSAWKKHVINHGSELFSTKTSAKQLEKKIQQLETLIGKKEVEIAFLKNVLDINY